MIIDLDSHLREGYFLDEVYKLDPPYAEFTPVRVDDGRHQQARFSHRLRTAGSKPSFNHSYMYDLGKKWRGGEIAERQVGGYDLDRRLKDIAREQIDKQVIFPTQIHLPASYEGGLGAALCRAYNNWVTKLVRGREGRFLPVAMMPAGCPGEMAGELRRAVKELGMKAAHLVPHCGSRNPDHPSFFPYYEAAEELDVPLFCHPGTVGAGGDLTERFDSFFAMHVLGRPWNCTPALVALVCGGVFERFPKLKVVFFECSAEWIAYWMHRMDDDYEWFKDNQAKDFTMPPSGYVRRNCYVTCEADEKMLPMAIEEIGAGHICMATDYPHFDSEFPHTVSTINSRADITAKHKELILGENARRLLNL